MKETMTYSEKKNSNQKIECVDSHFLLLQVKGDLHFRHTTFNTRRDIKPHPKSTTHANAHTVQRVLMTTILSVVGRDRDLQPQL